MKKFNKYEKTELSITTFNVVMDVLGRSNVINGSNCVDDFFEPPLYRN